MHYIPHTVLKMAKDMTQRCQGRTKIIIIIKLLTDENTHEGENTPPPDSFKSMTGQEAAGRERSLL